MPTWIQRANISDRKSPYAEIILRSAIILDYPKPAAADQVKIMYTATVRNQIPASDRPTPKPGKIPDKIRGAIRLKDSTYITENLSVEIRNLPWMGMDWPEFIPPNHYPSRQKKLIIIIDAGP
jgi:hypothetical protein